MKISGIDKDFEDIIYYLDNNGLNHLHLAME